MFMEAGIASPIINASMSSLRHIHQNLKNMLRRYRYAVLQKQLLEDRYGCNIHANQVGYMGNDQLLPAYNVQIGVADEFIAVIDVNQYRSDMDCFVPLMEEFHEVYGAYPKYPVADAGYGSFNNYIYCEQHLVWKSI